MTHKDWVVGMLAVVLGVQGCAITWTGHQICRESLDSFLVGQTTQSEVEKALGKPENVVLKLPEQVTVYIYQSVVSATAGLPFPLPIMLGRSKQRGFTLNILFKDGLFMGYELTEMKQHLLWR